MLLKWLKSWFAAKPAPERSPQWSAFRRNWLKLHPTCAACGTRKNCAVHHIWPVHFPGGREHELDVNNVITLCQPHHLLFGHLMDWKARNPHAVADAQEWNIKIKRRQYP